MDAKIIINGRVLTEAQSATVRSAIEALADRMAAPGLLGTDAHAVSITALYRARIEEIRALMFAAD